MGWPDAYVWDNKLSCHPALDAGSFFMSFMAQYGLLFCRSPPLWAIVFDAHLRACSTPIAHGVGSYKNLSLACHLQSMREPCPLQAWIPDRGPG
jgi:hypothetical protein